jgi:hypothetical protein
MADFHITILLKLVDSSIRIALWVRRAQVRRTAQDFAKAVPEGLRTARFESIDSAMGYRGAHASCSIEVWGSLALFVENVHKIASIERQMTKCRTSGTASRTSVYEEIVQRRFV